MRVVLPILCMFTVLFARAQAPLQTIDLNSPGAIEQLAQNNPAHYLKIMEILRDAQRLPEKQLPAWLETRFNARNVNYAPVLLTSMPPKRRLSFTLDATRYTKLLTLTDYQPERVPANER